MQVTRFAAPLAYNYLHVIRMQEYLGSDRVRSPTARTPEGLSYSPLCTCSLRP